MSLTYNLTLNTLNTTNIVNNTNLYAYQYYINWDAVLPRKFQEYQLTWTLKSVNYTTAQFTGSIPTTTSINVTSVLSGGVLSIGNQFYVGASLVTITAFGTGNGGIGTYTIAPAQTVNAVPALYQTVGSLNENLFVDINFGSTNSYEQNNQMSTKIGFVYPNVVQQSSFTWTYFYQATIYDNPPIELSYPSNNIITVKFSKFSLANPTTALDYVLELSFTPIVTEYLIR